MVIIGLLVQITDAVLILLVELTMYSNVTKYSNNFLYYTSVTKNSNIQLF